MSTKWNRVLVSALALAWAAAALATGALGASQQQLLEQRASRDVPGTRGPAGRDAPVMLWSTVVPLSDHVRCVRGIEDVDGDGFGDAVVGVEDASVTDPDMYVYSGHSSGTPGLVWSFNSTYGASGGSGYGDNFLRQGPDLNGDEVRDILYGLSWGGRTLVALASTGSPIWYFDTYVSEPDSGWVYTMDSVGDVNGDGVPDIVSGAGSDDNAAFCISGASSGSATRLWRYPAADAVIQSVGIEDVNASGYGDGLFVVGDNGHSVVCLEGSTGAVIWTYAVSYSTYDVNAIPDLNSDGIDDAVIALWPSTAGSNNVTCVSGASSGAATVLWSVHVGTSYNYIMETRPIADVNGDGLADVVVGSWDNAIICLSGANGAVIWSTPTGTLNGGDVWTIAAVADQNGDGIEDVVAGSFDQNIYLCDGTDGTVLWSQPTSHRIYSVYPIPDVNGDGIEDVVAGTQGSSPWAYCLSTHEVVPTPTPVTPIPATTPAGLLVLVGLASAALLRLGRRRRGAGRARGLRQG